MSKIEEILREKLRDEFRNQLKHLRDVSDQSCKQLSKCLMSNLETLEKLELTDATLFDFFEKTNGNIRVFIHKPINYDSLHIRTDLYGDLFQTNKIQLKKDTNYKIILMAIEQKGE